MVGDLLKSLSGGIARFVFAWALPSALVLGASYLFLYPSVRTFGPLPRMAQVAHANSLGFAAIFAFLTLLMAVVFAYTALPIYRVLEGYHMPAPLRRRLIARHQRKWHRLRSLDGYYARTGRVPADLDYELLGLYPSSPEYMLPTMLGNALKSLEQFGTTRYHLDSQRLWYELQGVAPAAVRLDTEEGRAPVDFFVSSIAHLAVLGVMSIVVVIATGDLGGLGVAGISLALIPLAYRNAVKNMKDWANSVKALVNLTRLDLADRLGLEVPRTLEREREMWDSYTAVIEAFDDTWLADYNDYRKFKQVPAGRHPDVPPEPLAATPSPSGSSG